MDSNTTEEQRSKKVRAMLKTMFDCLPYEMVWQILLRVPAQDLFEATMYVCKSWYGIIKSHDFIYAHLRRSTPGYLIQSLQDNGTSYMRMRQDGEIVLSKHNSFNVPNYYFWSSCNGLILESEFGTDNDENMPLTIKNPVTKQHLTLPPFLPLTSAGSPHEKSAIAYAATSMEYKVVATTYVDKQDLKSAHLCAILTVGVDTSWRLVDTRHISSTGTFRDLLSWRPLVTEGFVHWAQLYGTSILTMNVETEKITEIQIPRPECNLPREIEHSYFSVERSSSVSVLTDIDYFKWEVWEMKPETGEWTKMPRIDLVARKSEINRCLYEYDGSVKPDDRLHDWSPYPVGWLKYPEVIIFFF